MSSEPLLLPRVVHMGEALRPLSLKLKERANAPAVGEAAEPVTVEFLSHRLRELDRAIARLEAAVEAIMADVIAKEGADDTDVYRAVARLESRVDDFVDDRADLRCRAEGEFLEGARLLANVYDGLSDGSRTGWRTLSSPLLICSPQWRERGCRRAATSNCRPN